MALTDCQWQIRGLVLGPGTPWDVVRPTNPFTLTARADTGGDNTWNHGGWSGAEFGDPKTAPIRLHGRAPTRDDAGAIELVKQLNAAFQPVGETAQDIELRFHWGGREYLMLGRPRMSQPEVRPLGHVWADCAFVALRPFLFSGELLTAGPIELPTLAGGATLPVTAPFALRPQQAGGLVTVTNDGTADTGLLVRFDGPLVEPAMILQRPDGLNQAVRFHDVTLADNQFLLVDTQARTAFLDGNEGASRHPGHVQWPKAPAGASTLQFRSTGDPTLGTMTVSWRHKWW